MQTIPVLQQELNRFEHEWQSLAARMLAAGIPPQQAAQQAQQEVCKARKRAFDISQQRFPEAVLLPDDWSPDIVPFNIGDETGPASKGGAS